MSIQSSHRFLRPNQITELNPNYCALPPMNLGCVISYKCTPNYQRYNPLLVFFLSSHHGVAFASSCLSICKYAHIVAFKGVEQHLLSDVLVHLHLRRIVDVLRLPTKWRQRKSRSRQVKKLLIFFFTDMFSFHCCRWIYTVEAVK